MDKCYGEKLLTLATAISFKLAQSLTPDQLGVIGDLLSVLGDQLGLLSGTKENCGN